MLKIYGSRLCPDCVKCCKDLAKAGVEFEYLDFSEDLRFMKTFLSLRDSSPVFETVRGSGSIGIPCIIREDGTVTLTWDEFV